MANGNEENGNAASPKKVMVFVRERAMFEVESPFDVALSIQPGCIIKFRTGPNIEIFRRAEGDYILRQVGTPWSSVFPLLPSARLVPAGDLEAATSEVLTLRRKNAALAAALVELKAAQLKQVTPITLPPVPELKPSSPGPERTAVAPDLELLESGDIALIQPEWNALARQNIETAEQLHNLCKAHGREALDEIKDISSATRDLLWRWLTVLHHIDYSMTAKPGKKSKKGKKK